MLFQSFDGKEIFVNEWTDVKNPKGIVQIVHGMVEYGGRYESFARFLNGHGFLVVADDHRGHGKTDEETLGFCKGDMFRDTVRDEGELTKHYKELYPDLKYFVLGFSYGSFLTQQYISEYGNLIDGAVIAGSNYKKDFEVYFGTLVAHLNGATKRGYLIEKASFGAYSKKFRDGEWLSVDEENNAAYHADKYCTFTCTNRFYRDFFKGLRGLYTASYIAGLNKELPLLLASGKDDPVGNMGKGVQKLYDFYTQKAGMKNVEIKLFENSRHEFLNEKVNREEKWGALLEFFEKHC